jgi:hypothetical protein
MAKRTQVNPKNLVCICESENESVYSQICAFVNDHLVQLKQTLSQGNKISINTLRNRPGPMWEKVPSSLKGKGFTLGQISNALRAYNSVYASAFKNEYDIYGGPKRDTVVVISTRNTKVKSDSVLLSSDEIIDHMKVHLMFHTYLNDSDFIDIFKKCLQDPRQYNVMSWITFVLISEKLLAHKME